MDMSDKFDGFEELVVMRFPFVIAVGLVALASSVAFGGEYSDGTQSVLRPTAAPVQVSAPATMSAVVIPVAFEFTCANGNCPKQQAVCSNGKCGSSKLYNVEERADEHCRNRLLGGTVVRKSNRTVYKPVRR